MDAVTGAIVLTIVSFITMFATIFKGKALREVITYQIVRFVGRGRYLNYDDLQNHYIFTKFETINLDKISHMYSIFDNLKKYNLFKDYVQIIIDINRESVQKILQIDLLNATENDIQKVLIEEARWREHEYHTRFKHYLQNIVNNNEDINLILVKVDLWRRKELAVTTDASLEVLGYEKAGSLYNRLYTILHQYSLCLEIMVHSGADTFSLLNGELDKLLNNDIN